MSLIRLIFFLLFFLLLTHIDTPPSAETLSLGSSDVTVIYEKELSKAADEVINAYPRARDELVKTLGQDVDFRPEVVLVKNRDKFIDMSGSHMTIAFASPAQNLIVVDATRVYAKPFTLETTLKHELCHLILHSRIVDENIPRWFDEGVCQWASGGIAELMADESDKVLARAVVSGRLLGLSQLERFPGDGQSLILAYEESRSLVEFVVSEYGRESLLRIFDRMKKGDSMDESISISLSISPAELEKSWQAHLKRKHTLFLYLSDNLYIILFTLAALMTFYGFIRIIEKRRLYTDKEEEESQMSKYRCTSSCGYTYDPEKGDAKSSIDAGTPFEELPDDWRCPVCGAGKHIFKKEA